MIIWNWQTRVLSRIIRSLLAFFFSFPFSVGRLVFARPLVLYPPTDMKSYLGTLEASS